ncbi:hypothetical protein QOZ98_001194 [Planomicrobium stackebrandtii]|uniref:Uncharacterized protein n=1 Tax=Planomicrobium stackebrandtii TaxID=253160 RepID=A0ABU0GSU2_9BACL|nr:hypothetical protein [Planomicrobium stackebrandtii]MDQ0428368.1 hypothetical protein [Planomicrobium stackebrandtii]
MKKKLPMILAVCVVAVTLGILIIFGALFWLFVGHANDSQIEDDKAIEFIEEKYGMEAKIVSINVGDFVEGQSYEMAFEEQADVVFTVKKERENGATVYWDDYEPVLGTHEAQQQVNKLMPQIEELGFTKPLGGPMVRHAAKDTKTGETARRLVLETETSYKTLEANELQGIMKLLDLLRNQNIDVQVIKLSNRWEPDGIVLDLREIEGIQSVEEVEAYIVSKTPGDPVQVDD